MQGVGGGGGVFAGHYCTVKLNLACLLLMDPYSLTLPIEISLEILAQFSPTVSRSLNSGKVFDEGPLLVCSVQGNNSGGGAADRSPYSSDYFPFYSSLGFVVHEGAMLIDLRTVLITGTEGAMADGRDESRLSVAQTVTEALHFSGTEGNITIYSCRHC